MITSNHSYIVHTSKYVIFIHNTYDIKRTHLLACTHAVYGSGFVDQPWAAGYIVRCLERVWQMNISIPSNRRGRIQQTKYIFYTFLQMIYDLEYTSKVLCDTTSGY